MKKYPWTMYFDIPNKKFVQKIIIEPKITNVLNSQIWFPTL